MSTAAAIPTFTPAFAAQLMHQAGITLSNDAQQKILEGQLLDKLTRLWMMDGARCRCGLPLKFGRCKEKNIPNPAFIEFERRRETGQLTVAEMQNKPKQFEKSKTNNYHRFYYMCMQPKGSSCDYFEFWDTVYNGITADPRFKMFSYMTVAGADSAAVPKKTVCEEILALPDNYVSTLLAGQTSSASQ